MVRRCLSIKSIVDSIGSMRTEEIEGELFGFDIGDKYRGEDEKA